MTFSCPYYEESTGKCQKFGEECIPGRSECVLAGKVKFSEKLEKKIDELEQSNQEKKSKQK